MGGKPPFVRVNMERQLALLLLGPTGSGKTPLGQLLEARGLHGMRCVHFDFGENLRQIVAGNRPSEIISQADIDFLQGVLATGALLEDDQFPLTSRILAAFLHRRKVCGETWVVLNGLPRHAGQASALDAVLDVRCVVCLSCDSDAVIRRLASNVGGDRSGRVDDDLDRVRTKLEVFHKRTRPLVDHYRQSGARIITVDITSTTTPEDAWAALDCNPATM
jgi:adenylate kinase family enzyme